jgi:hypothetical protein
VITVAGIRYLTLAEAAARVEKTRRTVERWRLPRYHVPSRPLVRYVREDELLAALRRALVSNPTRRAK